MSKKSGKSIKEKRAAKRADEATHSAVDDAVHSKKR